MKTKLQIKSIFGNLLFEYECETVKELVIQAVKTGANLMDADLMDANLMDADLMDADLRGANLMDANLRGANLRGADLRGANLTGANLRGADLRGANLMDANLMDADLMDADLRGANLMDANLRGAIGAELGIARTRILPEGDLIGYKKCVDGVIVKLLIPKEAKRSSAFGRKCRAEYADVLEIYGAEKAYSQERKDFCYEVGKRVVPDSFDENWRAECSNGIHFFITKIEAENY